MKSIDINQLLAQDHRQQVKSNPIPKVKNSFSSSLNNNSILISTFKAGSDNTHTLNLHINSEDLTIIETKDQRSRQLNYNFKTHFLSVNKKKGSENDLETLHKLIRKLLLLVLKEPLTVLSNTSKGSSNMSNFMHAHKPLLSYASYQIPDSNTDTIQQNIGISLQTFSTQLKNASQKESGIGQQIKKRLLKALGIFKSLIISDSRLKKAALNTIHTLTINAKQSTYTEKSKISNQRFEFNMSDCSITHNQQQTGAKTLVWFNEKVKQMSRLLRQHKCECFSSS